MKKLLFTMFLLFFGLFLIGCESIVEYASLSLIAKDEDFNSAYIASVNGESKSISVDYKDLKEKDFYKNIMYSEAKPTDVMSDEVPSYTLVIKSNYSTLHLDCMSDLYAQYNDNWYLIRCSKEDLSALLEYLNPDKEESYKLTIQNDTSMKLLDINEEYKALEEVEVKMEYDIQVIIYVYLNGELLGSLTGNNSLTFNMPEKNSTLILTYDTVVPAETFKLNIIDNNNNIINKPEEADSYIVSGTEVIFYAHPIMDADLVMYVNGEFHSLQKYVLTDGGDIWEYYFIMPNCETTVEFKVETTEYFKLGNILEISNISASDVLKVRYEEGHIGVAPGTLSTVKYSTDLEDINLCLSILEIEVYEERSNNWQVTGGFYIKYSIITNDNTYDIEITNNYISVNQKHYKVIEDYVSFKNPSVEGYSFNTYLDNYLVYTKDGVKIGDFNGLSEFEFIPYSGGITGVEDYGYIEAEFGKIHIHDSRIFYIKEDNTYTYYKLVSEKTFDEMFK